MGYIFLAGIHGVGKSTLAAELKKVLNLKPFSVSDLIRKAGKSLDPSTKNTSQISQNQDLWKRELEKLHVGKSILLLDGHFCLLDSRKKITPLPFTSFDGTGLSKIILMKNEPNIIRERLLKRDKGEYSIELLTEFQECEQQRAIQYSEEKNIRLFIYDESHPFSELLHFITN